MSRKGRQTTLGNSLDLLMHRLDKKNQGAYQQIRVGQAWLEVAGEKIAGHTTQAHLKDRELVVYVDSPLWATELSALAEPYRVRMNEVLGKETVKTVRFTVSRRVDINRGFNRQEDAAENPYLKDDNVVPVPLTESELEQIKESVSEIPDEKLREAVFKATVTDLQAKKGQTGPKSP